MTTQEGSVGVDHLLERQDHIRLAQACGMKGNPSLREIYAHVDRIQNIDEMVAMARNLDVVQDPKGMSDNILVEFIEHAIEKMESTHWDDTTLDEKIGKIWSHFHHIAERAGFDASVDLDALRVKQVLGTDPQSAIEGLESREEANELRLDLAMSRKQGNISEVNMATYSEWLDKRVSELAQ